MPLSVIYKAVPNHIMQQLIGERCMGCDQNLAPRTCSCLKSKLAVSAEKLIRISSQWKIVNRLMILHEGLQQLSMTPAALARMCQRS